MTDMDRLKYMKVEELLRFDRIGGRVQYRRQVRDEVVEKRGFRGNFEEREYCNSFSLNITCICKNDTMCVYVHKTSFMMIRLMHF